jgi:uncharacterized lipoprotein YajG
MPLRFETLMVIASAVCLSACDTEIRIPLAYTPTTAFPVVPGAEKISLDVVAVDKRAQFKDRVGTASTSAKKIVTEGDPKELVRSALEHELKAEGFVVAAAGGLVITVELQNFYINYTLGSAADVAFSLRVRDGAGAGAALYTHYYASTSKSHGVFASASAGSQACLEEALAGAVRQVMEDKNLQAALLSAASRRPQR